MNKGISGSGSLTNIKSTCFIPYSADKQMDEAQNDGLK